MLPLDIIKKCCYSIYRTDRNTDRSDRADVSITGIEYEVMAMAAKRDYYEVLGVARDADAGTIKKAYRKLAKKYHPDTNPGDKQAEQNFKEVTEAYNVLSDPEKKKLYDQFGHAAFEGAGAGAGTGGYGDFSGFGGAGNGGYREYHFTGGGADMDDLFGDLFGDMFHGRRGAGFGKSGFQDSRFYSGRESGSARGADLNTEVTVSFDEAAFGCGKLLNIRRDDGSVQTLQVQIPAGIDDGQSIRLRGKGMPGRGGAQAGDLLMKVHVEQKPGFTRRGMDVYSTVTVPFTTAVFGGEAVVQTINGSVICQIQEGTQSGSRIRLRGKGIVSMKDASVHGDQYVTVQIQVPTDLTPEARQKLREFEAACRKSGGKRWSAA